MQQRANLPRIGAHSVKLVNEGKSRNTITLHLPVNC